VIWNAECLHYTSKNHKIVIPEVFTASRHQKEGNKALVSNLLAMENYHAREKL
jgi:hypothetical protein